MAEQAGKFQSTLTLKSKADDENEIFMEAESSPVGSDKVRLPEIQEQKASATENLIEIEKKQEAPKPPPTLKNKPADDDFDLDLDEVDDNIDTSVCFFYFTFFFSSNTPTQITLIFFQDLDCDEDLLSED